jgi:hypothetical protein
MNMKKIILIMFMIQMVVSAPLFACTGFFSSKDDMMLVGNNEDWYNPFTQFWVISGNKQEYGVIYFGFDDKAPQGGMNEQGLFFDGYATPPSEVINSKNKKKFHGFIFDKVMKECATVEEALKLISDYNLEFMRKFQIFLADKTGNSVIVEGDEIVRKNGSYQIVTNFRQSKTKSADYPCWRYAIVDWKLKENNPISIDLFRSILSDTSQRGEYPTQYSNIYDLKNGIIYLYQFRDFDHVFKIDLKEELKKGDHSYQLSSIFPENDMKKRYIKMFIEKHKLKLLPPHLIYFKIFLFGCAAIFFSVIVLKVLYWIFRFLLKSKKIDYPGPFRESALLKITAHYIGILVSIFGLILVFAFLKYSFIINIGLPCWNAPGLTKVEQLLLLVPMITGILTLAQVIFTFIAWKKRYGSLKMRCHYTLVTIASGLMVGLLIYWDLLRFCINSK